MNWQKYFPLIADRNTDGDHINFRKKEMSLFLIILILM